MEFIREHILLHKLLIVDGIGRSGKGMLSDIISCFERVEKMEYNASLEFISLAYKYNKIAKDMAIAILQTEMDTALYNLMIGRNINHRFSDWTSVFKYHSPEKYAKRAADEVTAGPVISDLVAREEPIFLNWGHDMISKSDLIFEAYDDKMEMIYINRKPADIICDWDSVGYSDRMAKDPTEMQYVVKYKGIGIPEVAVGWEDEYLSISPLERTVKMIHTYFKLNRDAICKKQNYRNLHVVNFEDTVLDPMPIIKVLQKIIGTEPLSIMGDTLHKQQCPRDISFLKTKKHEGYLMDKVSATYVALLDEMNVMYDDIYEVSKQKETVS